MKTAVAIEEKRLEGMTGIEDYPWFKERHRVFPAVFEDRQHKRVMDISAGMGCAAQRIRDLYPAKIICNDITPTCVTALRKIGLETVSFDLDDDTQPYPFPDGSFDAIVSLVTIEHLIHVDDFIQQIHRLLEPNGYLYVSTPNYAAPEYVGRVLFTGQSYHDPLGDPDTRYEFYAHVRYFTYKTLLSFVASFGFTPVAAYIAKPAGSARFRELSQKNRLAAVSIQSLMTLYYSVFPPTYASEPILCFRKGAAPAGREKFRKVVL